MTDRQYTHEDLVHEWIEEARKYGIELTYEEAEAGLNNLSEVVRVVFKK